MQFDFKHRVSCVDVFSKQDKSDLPYTLPTPRRFIIFNPKFLPNQFLVRPKVDIMASVVFSFFSDIFCELRILTSIEFN